jgi:two-component system response regulator FixJ
MCKNCRTVILVEDDMDLLKALTFSFQVEGYHVRAYASAEALLADADMVDCGCLIVDYELSGMNGLELVRRLRLGGVTLPAVLITIPSAFVTKRAAEASVPIVEKSVLTDTLFDKVHSLLSTSCHAAPH